MTDTDLATIADVETTTGPLLTTFTLECAFYRRPGTPAHAAIQVDAVDELDALRRAGWYKYRADVPNGQHQPGYVYSNRDDLTGRITCPRHLHSSPDVPQAPAPPYTCAACIARLDPNLPDSTDCEGCAPGLAADGSDVTCVHAAAGHPDPPS